LRSKLRLKTKENRELPSRSLAEGFRATLFHLGTLWRLNKLKLLRNSNSFWKIAPAKDFAFLAQNVKTLLDAARTRLELGTLMQFRGGVPLLGRRVRLQETSADGG
jgi:hypothetical protein